ncbi:MAG: SDR family oxidoreductase [Nocardioidaceae bacterium]
MRVVIVGGTGRIGSTLSSVVAQHGHTPVVASRRVGVNTVTGEGLAAVLERASVVVDVSNAPSSADADVLDFFTAGTHHLLAAEAAARVTHHVALSIVGAERLTDSAYFRAKAAQERLIEASSIPYTIVRATQFFEFLADIAGVATNGNTIRLPPVLVQPIAANDVAGAVYSAAVGPPLSRIVEVAGPQQLRLDDLIRRFLRARDDPRLVVTDAHARYFEALLGERTLLPGPRALTATTRFDEWLNQSLDKQVGDR